MRRPAAVRRRDDGGPPGPALLVTGAAGFLGSHLCERLLEAGASVWGLDSFDPHYSPVVKRRNLRTALLHPDMHLVQGDVRDRVLLDGLLGGRAFDAVIHLAALPGERASVEAPDRCLDVNVDGTLALLEASARHGVGRLVFASSASVYGESASRPFRESDAADRPISIYASSKRSGEMLCHTYHGTRGLSVHCLRIFSAFGPRQRPELAIHRFARLMRAGRPITMHGDGDSERDYTYVDDVVEGMHRSVRRLLSRPDGEPEYEVLNLGRGEAVRLDRLVSALAAALGVEPEIERVPEQPGEVPSTRADTRRARELLGWRAETSLEEGLAAFAGWLEGEGGDDDVPGGGREGEDGRAPDAPGVDGRFVPTAGDTPMLESFG